MNEFDELINRVKDLCSEPEGKAVINSLEVRKKRRQIITEYRKELKQRPGESMQIKRELAEKYFGDAETFYSRVHNYIYRSEESLFVN